MLKVSIVALIYKSKRFAEWVHDSVYEFTPKLKTGGAEFFFVANDPTKDLLNFLESKKYKYVVNENQKYTNDQLFAMGYGAPEYIHRVYKGWNRAILESKGEIVVLVNSDNYFSPDWLENLLKHLDEKTVVCSQLVERKHPKYEVFNGAYHAEFGNNPDNFDKSGFLDYVEKHKYTGTKEGGAYMPCAFYKSTALRVGLYPEGNIAGSNFDDVVGYGDEVFFKSLTRIGVKHITSLDSISYHLKEGEMDEKPAKSIPPKGKKTQVSKEDKETAIIRDAAINLYRRFAYTETYVNSLHSKYGHILEKYDEAMTKVEKLNEVVKQYSDSKAVKISNILKRILRKIGLYK